MIVHKNRAALHIVFYHGLHCDIFIMTKSYISETIMGLENGTRDSNKNPQFAKLLVKLNEHLTEKSIKRVGIVFTINQTF